MTQPAVQIDPRKNQRKLMKRNLKLFGDVICSDLTSDKSNCILHTDIQRMHIAKPRLAAIVAPRGHSKTTVASTIATCHDLAYDRENVIILIKKTFPQAVTDLQNIVTVIKYNHKFKYYFGNFVFLTDRQNEVKIMNPVTRHITTIIAKGAGQSIRGIIVDGKRPSKMLLDDFEDENNTGTVEQRQKVRDWMAGQVMPSLDPKTGHILAIGTIVHYDSWLNNLWENYKANENKSGWHVIFHQMIEDEKPIWPERFTPEYIEQIRTSYEELGKIDMYYQEYMNIPFNIEDADFTKDMITFFRGELVWDPIDGHVLEVSTEGKKGWTSSERKLVDVVIGYDLSSGTSGDYTGINVLATDQDNNRYDIIAERKKLKPNELKDRFFEDYEKYHPRVMVVEEEAHARIMKFWLRDEMRVRNVFLPLKPEKVNTKKSKEDKLRESLQPLYSSGIMHQRRDQAASMEELFTFPKGRNDDILDAKYYANKYAKKPFGKLDVLGKKIKKKITGIDWKTGVAIPTSGYDNNGLYREVG